MKWSVLLVGPALPLLCAAAPGARAGAPPPASRARGTKAYYLQPGEVVYFYANGDHTARLRNARVRVTSR